MPPEPASESLPTLRGIDWLAALLAGIAGATDATGILAFGRYTAHMELCRILGDGGGQAAR